MPLASCSFVFTATKLMVGRVVLLPLDVGFDINRRDQSHRMAWTADLPAPVMGAGTCLHHYRAAWL